MDGCTHGHTENIYSIFSDKLLLLEEPVHFKAHEEAHEVYMEQRDLVKQALATLAELDEAPSKGAGASKKSSKKHKEAAAMADAPESNL
jgi:hypothetical protein